MRIVFTSINQGRQLFDPRGPGVGGIAFPLNCRGEIIPFRSDISRFSRGTICLQHATKSVGHCRFQFTIKLIGPKLRSKLFGLFTPVRVVLHGLRRSPAANRRLGGEAARSGGICHLLGEYTVARPSRSQSRPVSGRGQQRFVLDDDLVDQDLHSTFEIVLRLENRFGRIVQGPRLISDKKQSM